jgi:hypothetical protein
VRSCWWCCFAPFAAAATVHAQECDGQSEEWVEIGRIVRALETALADATERLNREFTDEAYAEQQRLLKRKLEFDARLGQMASARAALSPDNATNTMAE